MSAAVEEKPNYESPAILTGKDGLPLASVQAKIWPTLRSGEFHLLTSADVNQILAKATSLQMSDGKQFQLLNLRLCNVCHPAPEHFEFDFLD